MSCPFCEIPANKERQITENDLAWAFPTNRPIVPGHTLVVPKRCVSEFEDMTEEEIRCIFDLRNRITDALKKSFNAVGFNFAWNDGKIAGQSVPHFHLHVVPRYEGDTGITKYEPRKFLYRPGSREASEESELLEVAKEIQKAL